MTERQDILSAARPRHRVRRLRLHSQHQVIVVMRADCDVCRSEGLAARSQVLVTHGERHIHAILFQVEGEGMLALDEIGVSEAAWKLLGAADGDEVEVAHPPALESLADVRRRIYGNRLDGPALSGIVRDVVDGRYSDVHLSSFLTASASLPLDRQETVALTRAMVDVGDRLRWDVPIVMDIPDIGIGAGFTDAEIGLRLRYEIAREFAPYIGVVHERRFGNTAALARAADKSPSNTSLVVGVRAWF